MQIISQNQVIKASGEVESFNEEKIIKSLISSGLKEPTAEQALDYLKHHLKGEISTNEIFGTVSNYLRETSRRDYINYGLKRAFMKLGPSGHPFERFIGDLFEKLGYDTQVGVSLGGECVTHEIDCIAARDSHTLFIECKYHNAPGTKTDIQVALYTYARFLDIEKSMKELIQGEKTYQPWLITNTKLTYDAINYSKCMDLKAISWNYPQQESLHNLIIQSGLHPITIIDALSGSKLQRLLDRDIVTCDRLMRAIQNNTLGDIMTPSEITQAVEDIKLVCNKNG